LIEDDPEPSGDVRWYVFTPSIAERLSSASGWLLGWASYALTRLGLDGPAERAADRAIHLQRHSRGAVRTLGWLAARRGRLAGRRGQLIVEGRVGDRGRFAGRGFFATYVVAAFNEQRALDLIRRFERDAIPSSLRIDSGELDEPDSGVEGVLYVHPGRTFFLEE
jgi:hypothetical protein